MRSSIRFRTPAVVLAVSFLALSACSPADENIQDDPSAETQATEMESPAATIPEPASEAVWTGDLRATGEASIEGTVEAVSRSSGTQVRVTLTGAEAGGELPWHVHQGTCGSGGPIVGEPTAYPPLAPDDTGQATASAQLTTPLSAGDSYHINVHQAPDAVETIVACGELSH